MYDALFKVVIFGDSCAGKTTLRKRFMNNVFIPDSRRTIGVDFETKILEIDGLEVKLMIWDFAGEEKFRFIFPQYAYGAMGGILMYDITKYSSFSHIHEWLAVLKETNQRFPIILLGGKADLDEFREIPWDLGMKAAETMNMDEFIECSSKTGENVNETFATLAKMMLNNMLVSKGNTQTVTV
jgi:small GTP-binding protein